MCGSRCPAGGATSNRFAEAPRRGGELGVVYPDPGVVDFAMDLLFLRLCRPRGRVLGSWAPVRPGGSVDVYWQSPAGVAPDGDGGGGFCSGAGLISRRQAAPVFSSTTWSTGDFGSEARWARGSPQSTCPAAGAFLVSGRVFGPKLSPLFPPWRQMQDGSPINPLRDLFVIFLVLGCFLLLISRL